MANSYDSAELKDVSTPVEGDPIINKNAGSIPSLDAQADYWRQWNQASREGEIPPRIRRQGDITVGWLGELNRGDLRILDVGCGSGWLCERLTRFGNITGLDLSPEMLVRAQARVPDANFIAGSIADVDLPASSFDVIVSLEVVAHVEDQQAFFGRCAHLLKAGGLLFLATQNRPIYERIAEIPLPSPNQLRKWVNARQLRRLSDRYFEVQDLFTICPLGYSGYLRFVNSVKLTGALAKVISHSRVEQLKERLGFGCTLMLRAEKKALTPSA